jgi:hypothetical protein
MKSLTEVREAAGETTGSLIEGAQKAVYAAVGAPVVVGRRLADYRTRMMENARKEYDTLAEEGEKFTGQLRERKLVDEIKEKVDLDQIQGRVTKIKDQLEDVLAGWRESFRPGAKPEDVAEEAVETPKPAAKKTTTKKTTTKKTATKSE